ncbi:hypothetical protein KPL71_027833 [Citrus sinensis]|uniref:Uncharacterized protein n=1 Tax=Citrus sinensis TaxID=2711 RepID=A0ACB8IA33_CITSI|nr:hypothetical protein KPL71_027833 [Citrus sinensis]
MKDFQTPQKEQSRPSDVPNRRSKETPLKKSQKILQKSLNAAFKTASEDSSPEKFLKELPDLPTVSENFLNPSLSGSPEPLNLSDLTPSSTISVNKSDVKDLSVDCHQFIVSNCATIGSVEADVLANLLREARLQVLNSADVNTKNKKLLDTLIKIAVDDFFAIPQERDGVVELVSMKHRIVFACFVVCILAVSVILFFNSEPQRAFIGPPPT